jgi:hypothetical protein
MQPNINPGMEDRKDPIRITAPLAKAARSTIAGLLLRVTDLASSDDPRAWEMAVGEAQEIVDALQQGASELRAAKYPAGTPLPMEAEQ